MSRTYQQNPSADIADFVRVLVRDAVRVPKAGLAIEFILRDSTGAVLSTAASVDVAGAPGWYAPTSLVLPASGTYTIEFAVPDTFFADSDTAVIEVPDTNPLHSYVRDTAIIGEVYRFDLLFTDQDNSPIAVTLPSIYIFNYDPSTGDRTTVVAPGTPLTASVPASTGRYIYLHLVADTQEEGQKLYAEIQGADPTSGGLGLLRKDYILNLQAPRTSGLGTSFVS
jgi:hypothetical protein